MEQEQENNTSNKTVDQDLILQAALKLFAQKGYFNTSLPDIAKAVELNSVNSLHQFFKTKQAIALALQESILDSLSISIDDIRRRNRRASEQLREIVDLMFRLTDEAPEIMTFLLFVKTGEFLPEQPKLLDSAPFSKIRRIIQNGIKDGEIRTQDPTLAYAYFFGIVQQTLSLVLEGALPKSADSYQSQAWLAAWSTIARK